ncbi:hypothetical protein ACVWYQ_006386 [Bradyrhizobium sp. USDA 3397]
MLLTFALKAMNLLARCEQVCEDRRWPAGGNGLQGTGLVRGSYQGGAGAARGHALRRPPRVRAREILDLAAQTSGGRFHQPGPCRAVAAISSFEIRARASGRCNSAAWRSEEEQSARGTPAQRLPPRPPLARRSSSSASARFGTRWSCGSGLRMRLRLPRRGRDRGRSVAVVVARPAHLRSSAPALSYRDLRRQLASARSDSAGPAPLGPAAPPAAGGIVDHPRGRSPQPSRGHCGRSRFR